MTIPQIEAILSNLGTQIEIKRGIPVGNINSDTDSFVPEPEEEHSTDDALAFIAAFQGL